MRLETVTVRRFPYTVMKKKKAVQRHYIHRTYTNYHYAVSFAHPQFSPVMSCPDGNTSFDDVITSFDDVITSFDDVITSSQDVFTPQNKTKSGGNKSEISNLEDYFI